MNIWRHFYVLRLWYEPVCDVETCRDLETKVSTLESTQVHFTKGLSDTSHSQKDVAM